MKLLILVLSLLLSAATYATIPEVPDEAVLVQDDENVCPNGQYGYKHWFNKPGTSPDIAEWLTFGLLTADGEHGPVVLLVRFSDDATGGVIDAFASTPAGIERFDSVESLRAKYPLACAVFALQGGKGA